MFFGFCWLTIEKRPWQVNAWRRVRHGPTFIRIAHQQITTTSGTSSSILNRHFFALFSQRSVSPVQFYFRDDQTKRKFSVVIQKKKRHVKNKWNNNKTKKINNNKKKGGRRRRRKKKKKSAPEGRVLWKQTARCFRLVILKIVRPVVTAPAWGWPTISQDHFHSRKWPCVGQSQVKRKPPSVS